MKNTIIFCLLAIALASAQSQKQRVAVLPSVGELEAQRLNLLTDKVREVASKTLPTNNFILLKEDAVMEMIGHEDYFSACKEGTCIGELAKKANANYGARCDVFKIDDNFALKFELYSVKDEAILETFTDYNANDFFGMLAVLEERLPNAFKKMIPSGSIAISQLTISSGIIGVEGAAGYVFDGYERSYIVNINTDPQGANLSFNGVPIGNCSSTPCRVELPEGNVRIFAALEQYETADTTISIKQNNQSVNIKLKPNFGILEIKPAYSNGLDNNTQWSLTINNKAYSSFENKLSPGNYEAKLSHECYEDISFKAGINKGKREVFDIASHIQLKMGGLVLSSEQNDEPVSEPVFANGKQIGETPFGGTVSLCSEISVGYNKEKVNVSLKHNEKIAYTHVIKNNQYYNDYQAKTQTTEKSSNHSATNKKDLHGSSSFGFGIPYMLNVIETYSSMGLIFFLNSDYSTINFIRFGLNLDLGFTFPNKDALKEIHPDIDIVDSNIIVTVFFKGNVLTRLYPTDFMYLSGGAGFGIYPGYNLKMHYGKRILGKTTKTVIFPVGAGLIIGPQTGTRLLIEALYNIIMFKNRNEGYWSFNVGANFKLGGKNNLN